MGLPKDVNNITDKDYVVIVQNDCIKKISLLDFIQDVFEGDYNLCQYFFKCFDDMGTFEEQEELPNQAPEFTNLYLWVNGGNKKKLTNAMFLNNYYDIEDDKLSYIKIVGGNYEGVTYNGEPIYTDLTIPYQSLNKIEFTSKALEEGYQQVIYIEVYDENNIKAI